MATMKTKLYLTAACLAALFSSSPFAKNDIVAEADRRAEQDQNRPVYPKTPFDPVLAKQMLEEGPTNIKGVLYHDLTVHGLKSGLAGYGHGETQMIKGVMVTLYPVQPHMVEWRNNIAKQRRAELGPLFRAGKEQIQSKVFMMDPQVLQHRFAAPSDEHGRFSFPKMRPGRYMLLAEATIEGSWMGGETIGRTTVVNGYGRVVHGEDVTKPKQYFFRTLVSGNEIIEIKPGKSEVEVAFKLQFVERSIH